MSKRWGRRRATVGPFALVLGALALGAIAGPAGAATPTRSYQQDVLADGPGAYWRLGDTSGATAADERGTNPGVYSNVSLNQPSSLACDDNASASFDGIQSYVRVPPSASLDMTSAVTIEFWAKRRAISSNYQVLIGKPGNGFSRYENYAVWLVNSNRYTAYFGNGSTYVSVSTPVITDTSWHHVVATHDGSTVRMYLDGVLKHQISTTLRLTANTEPLNLGRANSNIYFFNGWLDEAAVYPTALPATAVQAHYAKGLSDLVPPCLSLTTPPDGSQTSDGNVSFSGTGGSAIGDSTTITVKLYAGTTAEGTPDQVLTAIRQWDNSFSVSTGVPNGTWTAQAEQGGPGGTTGFSSANTFEVGGPPLPTITSAPPDPSGSTSASFEFSADQSNSTFRCSLDDAPFADCTSPQSYTDLPDGRHTFFVRAVDENGAAGPPAHHTWTIDATPPAVDLTSPANGEDRLEWPTFRGDGGTAPGDAQSVTVNVYSGPIPSGTPVQTLTAAVGTGGAYSVIASAPLDPGTYTAEAQQADSLGNTGSSVNTFSVGDPVVFAAGSISSCYDSGAGRVAALFSTVPDALVQTLGNNAYENGQPFEYANCYGPTWGVAKARTRPAVGNHDMKTVTGGPPPGTGYVNYFSAQLAPLGPGASDLTKLYYSYDLGAWHIVVLNDTCIDGFTPGCDEQAQEQWLRNDLAAHPTTCQLAVLNRPRWSSDSSNGNKISAGVYWNILYQYGADLVLDGATHHYERFAPQDPSGNLDHSYGIREIISGHGGYFSNAMGTRQPNSEVYDDTSYGVLKVTLHAASYDWEFVPVADRVEPAGGSFTDSGSTDCHAAPPPNLLPYRDQVLAASPAGYWRLGEASGTSAADEVGVNPGTYTNVGLDQPGALTSDNNPSASFGGTQSYVRVPASGSLDMTNAVTVEFWAKRRTISNTYQVVAGKPGTGLSKNENYSVWLNPSNRYTAYFGNGSSYVAVQSPPITDTNWHYIVATNNGSTLRMYVDGVLKQELPTTLQLTPNNQPLNIGRSSTNTYFFNGWLDEMAIYPTALSAPTIVAHYNRGIDPP